LKIEPFHQIDLSVFYFFNHTLSNPVLDKFFAVITNVRYWMPVYVLLGIVLIFKGKKQGRIALVLALVMIAISDQFGYRILKEFFQRERPFHTLQNVLLPIGPTGTYSFPSNHALNNFAVATFFSLIYPKYKAPLFIVAILISISRVYLGLHYPSDILGGAVIGTAFGFFFAYLHALIMKYWKS
jgi:undecaprenyl-diphosphatase